MDLSITPENQFGIFVIFSTIFGCPTVPLRYVLSHSIMDGEAARVQLEDISRVKEWKWLTLMGGRIG
jgi:hypothetical protein